ncbi:putative metal ion transporter C27B12.12c [Ceratocystis lukuohia]|uniref:Metal ion transporter C27B12.12c n=2 Tax=Ceratocystis TaxID=5157 RepID=A0ABR4MFY9_9PEZI|nr:putative metal ion transporter C27B12.12c [Ceratocystis platani]
MSDPEDAYDNTLSVPMLELDDHRRLSPVPQRLNERSRRGTFDTLYGSRNLELESQVEHPANNIHVRDFTEEAVSDSDDDGLAGRLSPSRRSRRMTAGSSQTHSPPNSVKAFAQARRREREMSFSDPSRPRYDDDDRRSRGSSVETRSYRSRPRTIDDRASIASVQTAEEDVCFPVQNKDQLNIDFDYLEEFINNQRQVQEAAMDNETAGLSRHNTSQTTAGVTMPNDTGIHPLDSCDGDVKAETEADSPDVGDGNPRTDNRTPVPPPIDNTRISFFSSNWESTIHAPELCDLLIPGEDIRGLFAIPPEQSDGVWWLNVNSPSPDEINAICKAFGVHPLTHEDIATQESREKIELFPAYYFVCFRSFNAVTDEEGIQEYEPLHIYAIVFREGTLSFSFSPNQHASHVRRRIALLKDFVSLSSDWICYALIDDIVDSFAPVIKKLERVVDGIEDSVFIIHDEDSNEFLKSVVTTRRNVTSLIRLLGGKADVLRGFTKRCNENYKVTPRMDIGLYLGDIQDHVVTMVGNLTHFEKMLSRVHHSYLTQLTVNSISQGTATNEALSKITFLASILVPLNLVSGLFGMNVQVPWRDTASYGPFFGIMGFMVIISIIMVYIAKRLRYI